jgi:HrpA-like RNA helicase
VVIPCPVLFIPGFTFPVTEYFKSDYESIVRNFSVAKDKNYDDDGDDNSLFRIGGYKKKGDIDYDLLIKLILFLAKEGSSSIVDSIMAPATGCMLIFMPGVAEINRVTNYINSYCQQSKSKKIVVLSLHGNMSPKDQKRVFQPALSNELKIVVSTNVAEASVTISDVFAR